MHIVQTETLARRLNVDVVFVIILHRQAERLKSQSEARCNPESEISRKVDLLQLVVPHVLIPSLGNIVYWPPGPSIPACMEKSHRVRGRRVERGQPPAVAVTHATCFWIAISVEHALHLECISKAGRLV